LLGERVTKDDEAISLDDAVLLLEEIERLRRTLANYEERLRQLDQLAHSDTLVALANRRSFIASLERVIANVRRHGVSAAIILADLDGLKSINDTFGHNAGDKALVEVSRLLVASVRDGDYVARLSGDEFGILLEHVDELGAWQAALRVVETVDEHEFCVDQVCIPLSVAVGAATISPEDTVESVLVRADKEMYRIKNVRRIES
jgi:diguanylate cyclase (GGDEF)-like protein